MMYLFQLTFLLNILCCLVWMCCLNHQTMLRSSRQSGQEGWEVWESFGPKESHPQSRMGFQHLVRSESSTPSIHQYLNEPWWTTNWGYRNNMARLGVILFKKKTFARKTTKRKQLHLCFFSRPSALRTYFSTSGVPQKTHKTTTKTKTKTSQLLHRGRRRSHAATNVSAAPRRIRSSANGVRSPPTGTWRNLYKVKQFAK